jgi:hypothetical protein
MERGHGVSAYPEMMPRRAPGKGRRKKVKFSHACPHLIRRWVQEPHPRYGDRVPYFRSFLDFPGPHDCFASA